MRLPGFEMIEKVGEGGMATVWKARQVSLDRLVAIKIMSSRLSSGTADVDMFLNEAQSTAKLKHHGIIQIYDANVKDGTYYYIMEYIAGYTVGSWVRRKGRLSETDALVTVESVADALEYAWEKERIIHCDIKPDNIMIDADGTVKVADLGLCKTMSSIGGGTGLLDEVMGTSCYMSPEQSQGRQDIDFRADIYSLGAMLYHLVTGKMMFQGESDDRIMELQCSGTVPDALEQNPHLSKAICWLIEKMLMKDRNLRYDSWKAVLSDMERVRRRHMPHGVPWPPGNSSMERSKLRTTEDHHALLHRHKTAKPERSSRFRIVFLLSMLGVGVFVYYRLADSRKTVAPQKEGQPAAPQMLPVEPVPPQLSEANAKEMFDFAKKWANENPSKYDDTVARYRKVAVETRGTKYSLMAEDEIKRTMSARYEAVSKVIKSLEDEASALVAKEKFLDAAAIYEAYSGPLAEESADMRKSRAEQLRSDNEQAEIAAKMKEDELSRFLNSVAHEICVSGLSNARTIASQALGNEKLLDSRDKIDAVIYLIDSAINIDGRILESFKAQAGKEISIELTSGRKILTIDEVSANKIRGMQKLGGGASVSITLGVSDLSQRERQLRMGSDDLPDVALFKGVTALNSKSYGSAKSFFEKTGALLAGPLTTCLGNVERELFESDAEKALILVFKNLDVEVGSFDADSWIDALKRRRPVSGNAAAAASDALSAFETRYGTSEFSKEAYPVIDALKRFIGAIHSSRKKNALGRAAALPPELAAVKDNPDRVVTLLVKKNPGLKARDVTLIKDDSGAARSVAIAGDALENIGPLAALTTLDSVSFRNHGNLKDISMFKGMALESFEAPSSRISDISALRGMPLKYLNLAETPVKDISPLKGAQLNDLNLSKTKATDFTFLAAMPLKRLYLRDVQIRSVSWLKGSEIESLDLAETRIFDFSFLSDMKELKHLDVSSTQFKNIELIKNMPKLTSLVVNNTPINDISGLGDTQISRLDIGRTTIKDFSVLRDLPLTEIHLSGTKFRDMELLKGKKLSAISIADTEITNLWPLKGMKLKYVDISRIGNVDCSVFAGMPVETLHFRGIPIEQLRHFARAPLKRIWCDDSIRINILLRMFPNLEMLNGERLD